MIKQASASDDPSVLATAIHVGDLEGALGSWLGFAEPWPLQSSGMEDLSLLSFSLSLTLIFK